MVTDVAPLMVLVLERATVTALASPVHLTMAILKPSLTVLIVGRVIVTAPLVVVTRIKSPASPATTV